MLFYWLLLVILNFHNIFGGVEHRRVIRQDGESSSCYTPENEPGTCINIKSCPTVLELLTTRGREPSIKTYLRTLQCGTEDNSPKVCCTITSAAARTTQSTLRAQTTQQNLVTQSRESATQGLSGGNTGGTDFSQCGKSDKQASKIIGGQNATLGDWPWIVALGYRTATNTGPQFKCGASLISNRWVLTAAHCVSNIGSLTLTTARVGDLNLDENVNDGATHVDVPVDEIIPHPEYSSNPVTNDIALIRLKNSVTFTKLIRPICILNEPEHRSDGFYARKLPFIIGWGAIEWRGPTTNLLQEAQIQMIDNENCAQKYTNKKSSVIDQRTLCAGETGKDACQGDSGGPLIIPIGDRYYLAGVVSYGIKCADVDYPGVYTRVAYFSDWISRTAGL